MISGDSPSASTHNFRSNRCNTYQASENSNLETMRQQSERIDSDFNNNHTKDLAKNYVSTEQRYESHNHSSLNANENDLISHLLLGSGLNGSTQEKQRNYQNPFMYEKPYSNSIRNSVSCFSNTRSLGYSSLRRVQFAEQDAFNYSDPHDHIIAQGQPNFNTSNSRVFIEGQNTDYSPNYSSCFTTYEALSINDDSCNTDIISKWDYLSISEGCTQLSAGSSLYGSNPNFRGQSFSKSYSRSDICDRYPISESARNRSEHCDTHSFSSSRSRNMQSPSYADNRIQFSTFKSGVYPNRSDSLSESTSSLSRNSNKFKPGFNNSHEMTPFERGIDSEYWSSNHNKTFSSFSNQNLMSDIKYYSHSPDKGRVKKRLSHHAYRKNYLSHQPEKKNLSDNRTDYNSSTRDNGKYNNPPLHIKQELLETISGNFDSYQGKSIDKGLVKNNLDSQILPASTPSNTEPNNGSILGAYSNTQSDEYNPAVTNKFSLPNSMKNTHEKTTNSDSPKNDLSESSPLRSENSNKSGSILSWPFRRKVNTKSTPTSTTPHPIQPLNRPINFKKLIDSIPSSRSPVEPVKQILDSYTSKTKPTKTNIDNEKSVEPNPDPKKSIIGKSLSPDPSSNRETEVGEFQFGKLLIKLHSNLSAHCRCQFEVWEAEAFCTDVPPPKVQEDNSDYLALQNFHKLIKEGYNEHGGVSGLKFALKFFEHKESEKSKHRYKQQSIEREGRLLKQIDYQTHHKLETDKDGDDKIDDELLNAFSNSPEEIIQKLSKSEKTSPTPLYLWYAKGINLKTGRTTTAVAMEMITGRSFSLLLMHIRRVGIPSLHILFEIAIKFVQSQRILAEELPHRIINWDTKPGNILIKFVRSATTGTIHCRRVVIIDIGDALPGSQYWFGSRMVRNKSPRYIICTKGHCSPECAIIVFLLASASNPKYTEYRKFWFGPDATLENFQSVRSLRMEHRWKDWIENSFLRKNSTQNPTTTQVCEVNKLDTDQEFFKYLNEKISNPPPSNGTTSTRLSSNTFSENMNDRAYRSESIEMEKFQPDRKETYPKSGLNLAPEQGETQIPPEKNKNLDDNDKSKTRITWEVNISSKSVVFSTGLILAQLFGGPSIIDLVQKDEIHAVDVLCEWDWYCVPNLLSGKRNYGPKDLVPTEGIFSESPWKEFVEILLSKCLAFIPSERWTFGQLEDYLRLMKSLMLDMDDA